METTPFDSDSSALDQLRGNFKVAGGILLPKEGYSPNERDFAAIDYLVLEWDYGYAESEEELQKQLDEIKRRDEAKEIWGGISE